MPRLRVHVMSVSLDGCAAALEQAFAAAGGLDVRLGGGAATVQQYLRAGLVDELHVAVVPLLLGGGERLFAQLEGAPPLECAGVLSSPAAAHVRLARSLASRACEGVPGAAPSRVPAPSRGSPRACGW